MFTHLAVVAGCTLVTLAASETPVQLKDMPSAVQKTVKEQTAHAKLRGLSKEVEKGKTFYEAETMVNGKSRDVLMDASGTVVEVEEEVTLESVPEAARKALQKSAGAGKILKVEAVTRGTVVSYEAVVQRGGKKAEVAVNADGSSKKD